MGFEGCCGLVGNRNYGPTNGMQVRNGSTAVRCASMTAVPTRFDTGGQLIASRAIGNREERAGVHT